MRSPEVKRFFCLELIYFHESSQIKRSVRQFFIGLSDAPKYDIICSETENLIDRFLPEILMFKECSKRVQHVSNKFSFSVQIMSYLGASDRPIKKLANSPFEGLCQLYRSIAPISTRVRRVCGA